MIFHGVVGILCNIYSTKKAMCCLGIRVVATLGTQVERNTTFFVKISFRSISLKAVEVPPLDAWRVPYLSRLLTA